MARGKPFCSRKIQENPLLCGRICAADIAQEDGKNPSGELCVG